MFKIRFHIHHAFPHSYVVKFSPSVHQLHSSFLPSIICTVFPSTRHSHTFLLLHSTSLWHASWQLFFLRHLNHSFSLIKIIIDCSFKSTTNITHSLVYPSFEILNPACTHIHVQGPASRSLMFIILFSYLAFAPVFFSGRGGWGVILILL